MPFTEQSGQHAAYQRNLRSALTINHPDDVQWDESADVVIVGYGGAGVCAALELADNGASVIAIDRFSGGGSTAFSGGVVYAYGTHIQQKHGLQDDADNMERYLRLEVGDAVSAQTLHRFCQNALSNFTWLESHGVKFGTELYSGKTTYPPEGAFLHYSGNEKVEEYTKEARPVPRGHRTLGKGFTGKNLYAALRASADSKPIKKLLHSTVHRLIADKNGAIVGVELLALPENLQSKHQKLYDSFPPTKPFKEKQAEAANEKAHQFEQENGRLRYVRATRDVIIATGGFVYNLDLLREHAPLVAENYQCVIRLGNLGDDGSAERLGKSVQAGTARMKSMFLGRVQSPPAALLDGILVNCNGERFVNEAVYVGSLGQAIVDQPHGQAWLLLTKTDARKALRQIASGGMDSFMRFGAPALLNLLFGGTKQAPSIVQIAQECGLDPIKLQQTMQRYD